HSAALAAFAPQAASSETPSQLIRLSALAPDKTRSLNLYQFVKASAGETPVVGNPVGFGVTPLGGMPGAFPAPLTFLTRRVLAQIAAERSNVANRVAQLSAERSALQPKLDDQVKQVQHMELEVGQWPADVNVALIKDPSTNPPTVSEYDVAGARLYLERLRDFLTVLQAKAAQLEQAVALQSGYDRDLDELRQYYEGLWRPGDENDIFVLGFVCSATPKSPDPDPALFT